MAEIILPNLNKWSSAVWGIVTGDHMLGTLGDTEQVIRGHSPLRTYQITLQNLSGAERQKWRVRLEQLTNLGNYFLAEPPEFKGALSGYTGNNPLVDGSGQLGMSMRVKSATANAVILMEGDYFEINGTVKSATADVTANGLGKATIPFYPALRKSPLNNAVINISSPKVKLRFQSPSFSMNLNTILDGSTTINAIEAMY